MLIFSFQTLLTDIHVRQCPSFLLAKNGPPVSTTTVGHVSSPLLSRFGQPKIRKSGKFQNIPGLVNVYITMENHHAINGKLTISMAMFNSYVKLPEGSFDLGLSDNLYQRFWND